MRNLKNLGFRVPLAIVNKAHQANQLYPFAISLIESVRTYERTLEKVRDCCVLLSGLTRNRDEKGGSGSDSPRSLSQPLEFISHTMADLKLKTPTRERHEGRL